MKRVIILSLFFSFIFSGCSEKEAPIVFQDKLVCTEQQKLERIEPIQIRIYNDDVEVAKAYKIAIDTNLDFYEKQVDRNNILCKEMK